MTVERVGKGCIDLISSLPDEVLGKILSFLPTKIAASTSVLAKRWRNLLLLVENLDFSDAIGDPRGFCDFVDKTLALLSNSSAIKSFSLYCGHDHKKSRVDGWIRTVLERSFLELHLETAYVHDIDTDFFTSNTLVKLTLSGGFYPHGFRSCDHVFFPALKTLSLVSVEFADTETYVELISDCPLLEELFLHYADDGNPSPGIDVVFTSISVSNPSIKRLNISYDFPGCRRTPIFELFHTPSLVYLELSRYVAETYDVDLGSLVEARLDLRSCKQRVLDVDEDDIDDDSDCSEDDNDDDACGEDDDNDSHGENVNTDDEDEDEDDSDGDGDGHAEDVLGDVTDLVSGITNIRTLHLSPDSLEVLYFCCKSMPVFHNLLTLSFESDKEKGWQVLPLLLNNSPNLETLIIEGLVHQDTDGCGDACICKKKKMEEEVCCLSTCPVKVLDISGYGGTYREYLQMKHFLRYLKYLETVKVGVEVPNGINVGFMYPRITNALTNLPKASSKCQILFF